MTMKFKDIEGATPLEQEEIDDLLLDHITTREELNRWEFENIHKAEEWLSKHKGKELFTNDFICLLHKKMFSDIWKLAGKFRKSNKNIGIDKHEIEVDLKKLCDDALAWIEFKTFSPDEFVTRFHHRLVYIHPFTNGNGRHARLFADLILKKIFKEKPFSWGNISLIEDGETRKKYIDALRAADSHDYSLLLDFVRS